MINLGGSDMILTNNDVMNTQIWNEVKNWAKEDKITLITMLSQSLADISIGSAEIIRHTEHSHSIKGDVVNSIAYKEALARMKTLSGKGGMPVPEDENDLNALIEAKYKL